MRRIFTTVFFAMSCNLVFAQAGSPDVSFGNQGIVRTKLGNPFNWGSQCTAVLRHPDGSFYLVIIIRSQVFVSHRLANGTLDLAYGENGYSVPVYMASAAAVMQPDGKIVIGGSPEFGNQDFKLARLNTNGFPDNSFSGDGKVTTDFFQQDDELRALALQPDGKIVAVGTTGSNVIDVAVARYNPDGSLDNSFSEDGLQITPIPAASSSAEGVAVQSNGNIIVAGSSNTGNIYSMTIWRYLPNGVLDNTFSGDGIQTITLGSLSGATAVAVQPDGKIVAGGYTFINFNVSGFLLARLNTDGTPDNSFSGDGIQTDHFSGNDASILDFKLQPDGKILAAGFSYIPGYREFTIARYNSNGTLDSSFSGDGVDAPNVSFEPPPGVSFGSANAVALMSDGKIMVAGNYLSGFAAVRYHSNGTLDNSLDGDGILKETTPGGNTIYRSSAVQADGKLVVVGVTSMWTPQPQFVVVRYNTNGTPDHGFSGDGILIVDFGAASAEATGVAIQPDGKILIAGTVTQDNNGDFALVRLNANGTFDNSFSGDGKVLTDIRGYNDGATGIAIRPDGRIVVGGYSNLFGSDDDFAVVQYLSNGNLDPGFSGDGKQTTDLGTSDDHANAVILQGDGKIVLAGRKGFTAQFDHKLIALVRYNTDGSLDASFDGDGIVLTEVSGRSNEAYALAIDANGRIVTAALAGSDLAILRYMMNGLPDNSFSGDGRQLLTFEGFTSPWGGLVIQPNGKLIVGTTLGTGINDNYVLARLNTDGSLDNSFSGDGKVQLDLADGGEDNLFALSLHGNRVYAVGNTLYGGRVGSVVALLIDEAPVPDPGGSPYLVPVLPGVSFTSILTAGDSADNHYRMVGIPDGLGAFDNYDGTFTLLMNHQLSASSGIIRAHGSTGAFVSKWIIRKYDLRVLSGSDLIRNLKIWNNATSSYNTFNASNPYAPLSRFSSADLPKPTAFFNPQNGRGTQNKIFLNGEESGTEGRAFAHIATGPEAGTSYELPRLGKFSWENAIANPHPSNWTIVAGTDHAAPGQVYFYIGAKSASGNDIDRAGLNNGNLYGVVVTNYSAETNVNIPGAGTAFWLANLGHVEGITGIQLESASNAANVTTFLRPEDGVWDPQNPNDFYFVTTNNINGPSRLWKLHFHDLNNLPLGGTVTVLLNGTEGQMMLDNITMDKVGNILMQEDVDNNARLGKIWQYNIHNGQLKELAQHNPLHFISGAPMFLTQDEESSGIIDVSSILGPGMFLTVVQAHYPIPGELVEGGQVLAMINPASAIGPVSDSVLVCFNGSSIYVPANMVLAYLGIGAQIGYCEISAAARASRNIKEPEPVADTRRPGLYPNPSSDKTALVLTLPEAGKVSITIFDANGKHVAPTMNDYYPAGYQVISLNTSGLVNGIYVVRVISEKLVKSFRLVVIH